MIRIEVIGLEPPCQKCNELLENAKKAAKDKVRKAQQKKQGLVQRLVGNMSGE